MVISRGGRLSFTMVVKPVGLVVRYPVRAVEKSASEMETLFKVGSVVQLQATG